MDKKRLLIIDDEKDFCNLVKEFLEKPGDFQVDAAHDGKSGIASAKRTKPDLILLDMLMPEMNGLEVIAQLKSSRKTMAIPVVALSAVGDEEIKIKSSELFTEGYLTKPVKFVELKEKVKEVLRRRSG